MTMRSGIAVLQRIHECARRSVNCQTLGTDSDRACFMKTGQARSISERVSAACLAAGLGPELARQRVSTPQSAAAKLV